MFEKSIQKLKRLPFFIVLYSFLFIEHMEKAVRKSPPYIFRGLLLIAVVLILLCGFKLSVVTTRESPPLLDTSEFLENLPRKIVPVVVSEIPFPELSAKSVVIADIKSNKLLKNFNGGLHLAPASTTKLLTALVALELYDVDEYLTVPNFCTTIEGTKLGLLPGEIILARDLFYGVLVSSSSDAACVFANVKTSAVEFMRLMNQKAAEFGMQNTHFTNAVGLDGVNGAHYSCAFDLYLLAKKALQHELLREVVKTKEYDFASGNFPRKIYTTNYLLWAIPESAGVKTGKTEAAGEVLIYEYKDDKKDLIIVVMGSNDRFLDTRVVLDWTLASYSWD